MEKPAGTPTYIPPRTHPTTSAPSQPSTNVAAGHWQATERTSFESALNRIRDRNQHPEQAKATTEAADSENIMNAGDELKEEDSAEISDELAAAEGQSEPGTQFPSQRLGSAVSAEPTDTMIIDMALSGTEFTGGAMVGGTAGEAVGSASGTPASTAGSTMTAESVAQMMARLERAAGTHDGHWRFGVLNDQAGVTALQLQRSVQGGWRINVSFNEAAQIDEQLQADELKEALLKEGHEVDSVVISRLATHLAFDD